MGARIAPILVKQWHLWADHSKFLGRDGRVESLINHVERDFASTIAIDCARLNPQQFGGFGMKSQDLFPKIETVAF